MVDNLLNYVQKVEHIPLDIDVGGLSQIDTGDLLNGSLALETYEFINFTTPPHLDQLPDLQEIETEYDFNILLNSETSGKSSWIYSNELKKVFIKIGQTFNFNIAYKAPPTTFALPYFLRAMVLFSTKDDVHLPVSRCHNHRMALDASGKPAIAPHILKCVNPNSSYTGSVDGVKFRDRLSIIIPLGAQNDSVCTTSVSIEFACQNSCTSGMNRRPTVILFTLENENQDLLGKRLMNFKVCSCPKRDREKEEGIVIPHGKKRRERDPPENQPPNGKKPAKFVNLLPPPEIKTEPVPSPDGASNTNSSLSSPGDAKVVVTLELEPEVMEAALKGAFYGIAGKMAQLPKDDKKADMFEKGLRYVGKAKDNVTAKIAELFQ